ncbi:MAG: RIP metalloprotease RseP, partial [Pseudomonadota bacterium]|nr:RIP metalloprotease RseP [Pseudomonadota bacterium]
EREGPVPPEDVNRAFNRRPPLARIAVLLAGPGANFLFAIFAYWLLFMQGVPGLKPVIGDIATGSLAAAADLRPGDLVLRVGEDSTGTRQAMVLGVLDRLVADGRVPLEVQGERGGRRKIEIIVPADERRGLTEPGTLLPGLGFSFWYPPQPVVVGELTAGMPAALAGLRIGDRVDAVDGVAIDDFSRFIAMIQQRAGQATRITATRDGRTLEFALVPERFVENGRELGRIGLGATRSGGVAFPPDMLTIERYGPFAAIAPAIAETWEKSSLTVRFLWRMVTGDVSTKNISGPINIAQYAGLTATEGFTYYLGFLALVSISLAVLNLLPVPVLDGGQIAYQLVEMAKGAPLSMEAQVLGQKVGIAMLALLMGFAFYNDITRLFG